jgi:hypothetical protein
MSRPHGVWRCEGKHQTFTGLALLARLGNVRLAAGKNDFRHVLNPVVRGLKALHLE